MNRRSLPSAALMAAIALLVLACRKPEPIVAAFFHDELCAECEDYRRAERISSRLLALGRADGRLAVEAWQAASGAAIARLKEIQGKYGLPDLERSLPCLVVDGRVAAGYRAIEEEISRLEAAYGRSSRGGARSR